jgi:hypothetical protein
MRVLKQLTVVAAAAGLFLVPMGAASASVASQPRAAAAQVKLTGGQTTVTTAPGIAGVLLQNGIVPIATWPGTEGLVTGQHGIAVRFGFPVTGGELNPNPLSGTIDHRGGILFLDLSTGKQIAVSNFVINIQHAVLTAIVNGNPKARVPLLSLNLAHAKIHLGQHCATASGIGLRLTATAASALDSTFSTSLFKAGLDLGTASTEVRF